MKLLFHPRSSLKRNCGRYTLHLDECQFQVCRNFSMFYAKTYGRGISQSNFGKEVNMVEFLRTNGLLVDGSVRQNFFDRISVIRKHGYVLKDVISVGKNGYVFEVEKKRKKYVFKIFSSTRNLSFLLRIRAENFVPLVEISRYFYVQEYLFGKSLDRIKKISKNKIKKILSMLDQIQKDLFRLGVIHGDIHPGNFMLARGKLYLIDFDQSFLFRNQKLLRNIIQTGAPGFVHPDVKQKKILPNFGTDAFSFRMVKKYLSRKAS